MPCTVGGDESQKPRQLLLVLCTLLVLCFLYNSIWRLHLWGLGHKPLYDKHGFLAKLDYYVTLEHLTPTPKESCRSGYAAEKMTTIYPWFIKPAPMFLDMNYRALSQIRNFYLPFGTKRQEWILDYILKVTNNYGLGEEFNSLSCKKCIVVGNGGILTNKSMGVRIDAYDLIVRLNNAPVRGYEKDVGSRTTMRITYPEGAFQNPELYETDSLFVLSAFKSSDFQWLRSMIFKRRMYNVEMFWKSVAQHIPREPGDMRILNPYFIQEAAFKLIGLPRYNEQNIPTLGAVAITMALHNCDEVDVAGFGYDMGKPHAPLHYYENTRMAAMNESSTHNICQEKEFLIKLLKEGVIRDLTNGILRELIVGGINGVENAFRAKSGGMMHCRCDVAISTTIRTSSS
ncbi:hypothetical protein DPEC_G00339320 [Dallia pectoralis]|uniref:Uncharacterized protein n=1 Tax=Dallia pectoralis TaxID=75939 RepID=A0ACC2F4W5_DALPE|nr:hypothetical protein DPEC_G00339320 [Dallia pectoralis]